MFIVVLLLFLGVRFQKGFSLATLDLRVVQAAVLVNPFKLLFVGVEVL